MSEKPESLIDIIKCGVLIQSNYGSFIEQYGKTAKNTVEILLENRLINFLGSDTHKQGHIYDNINTILKKMKEIVHSEKYIYQITTSNPQKILNDVDININCPKQLKTRKKLFFFN